MENSQVQGFRKSGNLQVQGSPRSRKRDNMSRKCANTFNDACTLKQSNI